MEGIRAYLLSVSAAALLCGIANRFLGKNTAAAAAKILTGLFLTLTVLQPLGKWDPSLLENLTFDLSDAGEQAVAQGEKQTQKALAQCIKEETAAYILEKARELKADIHVTVEVSEGRIPVPTGVQISGTVSPYARTRLQTIIEEQLGIAKENQRWT